jgi:myo-inositol-1(or 4)-monophosphatase
VADLDLQGMLAAARRLAGDAGTLLVQGLGRIRAEVGTKSTVTDMVTEMDRASERLIVDGLRRARPDDGVLGEEGSVTQSKSGVCWLVDPIDGTTNYLYGHPGFAVSVAAELDGESILGVVVDPLHRDEFTAIRGEGAFRNGQPIHASDRADLATALVATGFSYSSQRRARQAEVLATVLPRVRDIRRMGAAAVDLCWVACGRLDAFYEKGLQPWDLAAGALVAAEAGATVGDLAGGRPSGDFVLASAPAIHDGLRQLLTEAGAADA